MTPALLAYRLVTAGLSPILPMILARRVRAGKEDASRLNERAARQLQPRPVGRLLWCHGASVGESLMLHGFCERLRELEPDIGVLFTSQTLTAAKLMTARLRPGDLHQFAPLDTPGATRRFLDHWRPDAGVFAESEIWPNLLLGSHKRAIPMALINARSTHKSLKGWERFRSAAKSVFGVFDPIIAADDGTAKGLSSLLDRRVDTPGNLKASLPPPAPDGEIPTLFQGGGRVLLAASTHAEEEVMVFEAWSALQTPRPHLVIAPRHPERAGTIRADLESRGGRVFQRSRDDTPEPEAVYLADTLGEMGLWYRLADLVYLGGGHAEGIGGHNPLEPLRCGCPVITGPALFNFETVAHALKPIGGFEIAKDRTALVDSLAAHFGGGKAISIDPAALNAYFANADKPMAVTLEAVRALLRKGQRE